MGQLANTIRRLGDCGSSLTRLALPFMENLNTRLPVRGRSSSARVREGWPDRAISIVILRCRKVVNNFRSYPATIALCVYYG